jgi:hypothetical protein
MMNSRSSNTPSEYVLPDPDWMSGRPRTGRARGLREHLLAIAEQPVILRHRLNSFTWR